MLTQEEEIALEAQIKQLHDETGVELAILTITTTDGQDIAQFGTEVAQSRGIGKATIDNGILIMIALDDRKWRIDTGYGVEWLLPDALAYRIGTEVRVPAARAGDYVSGLEDMVAAISWLVHEDPEMMAYWAKDQGSDTRDDGWGIMPLLMFVGLFGWLMLWSALRSSLTTQTKKLIASGAGTSLWTTIAVIVVGAVGLGVLFPTLIGWILWLFSNPHTGFLRYRSSRRWWYSWWFGWWSFGWWFGWFGGWSFGGGGASGGR